MEINSIEDYELSYNLFLAEQEMFKDLAGLSYNAIVEGTNIVALQEGVKETVMNYLQKIMTQIQNIWSKFQANFTSKVATFLEKKVSPVINKAKNASFSIDNYIEYDLKKLDTIQIPEFQYNDQTKEHLQSEAEYIKFAYSNLPLEGGTDLKKALARYIATKVDKYPVKQEQLEDMFKFCKEGYKEYINSITADINKLNNSSKTITSMVSTVTAAQEAFDMLSGFGIVLEVGEDNDPTKGEKMTFTDNSGETSGQSKEQDKAKAQITTAVTVYMTASTKLLSAKMSMVNSKFKSYIKILTHLVEWMAKNKTGVVDTKTETPTAAPQANIK